MDTLDERTEALEWEVHGLKRKMDCVLRGTRLVAEGFPTMEALWVNKVEGAEKKWQELKQETAEALCSDIAAHLQIRYPPEERSEGTERALWLFRECLQGQNVVKNVHAQTKWNQASGARDRLQGVFVIVLNFSHESLAAGRSLKVLDKALAQKSGIRQGAPDQDALMAPAGGAAAAAVPKRLLYPERTPEEREKAQARKGNKGKGKGKGGGRGNKGKGGQGADKGKGKGKGKGGRGGRGGAQAAAGAAGAGADPAAAAAAPAAAAAAPAGGAA
jgi:hypothetical protein